eukprot:2135913-Rhodomonas_salina.1
MHRHPHCREHAPRGTHQRQELKVLVPVKEGVRAVFGAHSVRQSRRLVRAPLVPPRTRTQCNVRNGDVTHRPRHVGAQPGSGPLIRVPAAMPSVRASSTPVHDALPGRRPYPTCSSSLPRL